MKFQGATSPPGLSVLALGGAVLLSTEVALQGEWPGLALAGVGVVAAAVLLWQRDRRHRHLQALMLGIIGALLLASAWRVRTHSLAPGQVSAAAAVEATQQRDRLLSSAIAAARRSAVVALSRAASLPAPAIPALADLLSGQALEQSLVLSAGDTILAVAGPHRFAPLSGDAPLALVVTPFIRQLVVREVRGSRVAQVGLLLDASTGVVTAGPALAGASAGWQGVEWAWTLADTVVRFGSIGDAVAGVREVMQPVASQPAVVQAAEREQVRWLIGGALLLLGVTMLLAAPATAGRAVAMLLMFWSAVRLGIAPAALGLASLWALVAASALLLVGILLWRKPLRRSPIGVLASLLLLATCPLLVLRAANVIVPVGEVDSQLPSFGWQAVLALAAAAFLTVATAPLRTPDDRHSTVHWGIISVLATVLVGALGIIAWTPSPTWTSWSPPYPPGIWASWYRPLWLLPLAALLPRTTPRARLIAIATLGGALAALAVWSVTLNRRIELATADLDRLAAGHDSVAVAALEQFAVDAKRAHATRIDGLYAAWRSSELARDGVPVHLALWSRSGVARESVALDSLNLSWGDLRPLVENGDTLPHHFGLARDVGHHEVLVVPLSPDTIATVTIGPRSRVVAPSRFGRVVGWRSPTQPSYTLRSQPANGRSVATGFRRVGRFLRAERVVDQGGAPSLIAVSIEMASQRPFAVRAALVVLLDALLFLAFWLGLQWVLGADASIATQLWRQSYRRTLAVTLTAFFVVPAALFTLYSVLRLRSEAARERTAEVSTTLKDVEVAGGFDFATEPVPVRDSLARVADSVDAELAIYRRGRLVAASASLLAELGLLPPVVDPTVRTSAGGETSALATGLPADRLRIGVTTVGSPASGTLLAAVLPGRDNNLAREQLDLALLLLLTSLAGTLAAVTVAGFVARALGEPIGVLQRTALAIGRRESPPPVGSVPAEFAPVFGAIRQMELDLHTSEAQLEAGRTRTAAILATVATGVIGVDAEGNVIQANPRSAELLGRLMEVGRPIAPQLPAGWGVVAEGVLRLLGPDTRDAESREIDINDQRLAVTLAPLGDGGLVLAITDITEASRAARIVAWGEMARQVAHEIKNPLTPMRLGLQHLRRIRADEHPDFPRLVDETAERLLGEIERLDRIARSFARYGAPPERPHAEPEKIVVHEAVAALASLYDLGDGGIEVMFEGDRGLVVLAPREELAQVLLNLVDNAREAGATVVRFQAADARLTIRDNGQGIPPDQLARIFEPTFSTTTSGTGLGLAIVRRLVEGWGATIAVASAEGEGATFTIDFGSTPAGRRA
ncbi:MAG: ATP-binding protein [Gemmatimonadota bacterium]